MLTKYEANNKDNLNAEFILMPLYLFLCPLVLSCLTLSTQQTADSYQWVQHELALAYEPLLSKVTTLASLHFCPPSCSAYTVYVLYQQSKYAGGD